MSPVCSVSPQFILMLVALLTKSSFGANAHEIGITSENG